MLYLESFVHRVQLAEIVSRWLVNQPEPGDVHNLKRIISFNTYIARLWSDHLVTDIVQTIHGDRPQSFRLKTKGQLKDLVLRHPLYVSPRIEEIRDRYLRFPEDFYRETPIDGRAYFLGTPDAPRFVASTRLKRFRRIAEKGSRRIVDFMFSKVRANADALAEERAHRRGLKSKDQLLSSPEEMDDEFRHAERRLIKSIRQGTIQSEFPILAIPDVVGMKLIVEDEDYDRVMGQLEQVPACRLVEKERHTGRYNATNVRLAYTLPREMLYATPPTDRYLDVLRYRGFNPDTLAEEYASFLETAEQIEKHHVIVEVIVSSFAEFIESEAGRSMHEERVLGQRAHSEYNSHLATNIRWLVDYILTLGRSPLVGELADVPIKLWVRYMPDTFERILQTLFVPEDYLFDTVEGMTVTLPNATPESVPPVPILPVVGSPASGQR